MSPFLMSLLASSKVIALSRRLMPLTLIVGHLLDQPQLA